MKKVLKISAMLAIASALLVSCFKDYPIDEDGLLISHRTRTSILNLDMLDLKYQTALHTIPNAGAEAKKNNPFIDTLNHYVVRVIVKFTMDPAHLWPKFSLADDCKLNPKVTAFTDFSQPREYTVISGDRKHSKTYKVYVIKQDPADPDNYNPSNPLYNPWYEYFKGIYGD